MSSSSPGPPQRGELAAAISNAVVRVFSTCTGRGPTRARTYLHDDLVTVLVQDTLTRGERTLVGDGKARLVLSTRREFQDTMRSDLVAQVEELTGRTVVAFFSDSHIDPDAALESFLLAPREPVGHSVSAAAVPLGG